MKVEKKVGLVTLYSNNYGSILQCFATKKTISDMGVGCVVLGRDWKKDNLGDLLLRRLCFLGRSLRYKEYFKNCMLTRKAMGKELSYLSGETKKLMDTFVYKEISPQIYSLNDLWKIGHSEEYCAFVTGSDQVWNLGRELDFVYFLDFAPEFKRIAFSVSCGIEQIPEFNKRIFKKKIEGYTQVSVREESAGRIIESVSDVPVLRIADPTFLLSDNEWRKFGKESYLSIGSDYIMIHFLNEPSSLAIDTVNYISDNYGFRVICLGYRYSSYTKLRNYEFIDGGPREYVKLIMQSNCICTDSFHTALFAINLKKTFFVFERQYLHNYPQTSRITDMLKRYGMIDYYITDKNQMYANIINRKNVEDTVIENERLRAKEYLEKEIMKKIG